MSELIQAAANRKDSRWKLLVGASTLTFMAYLGSAAPGLAEDQDKPQVWIDLGGQLSRLGNGQEAFSPSIMSDRPSMFDPSEPQESPPLYSFDEEGSISFQPKGTDWVLSAAVRYGRASANHNRHQQTYPDPFQLSFTYYGIPVQFTRYPAGGRFADTESRTNESHMVLDFQVGKDVGLGLFGGRSSSSIVSLVVRFAQFTSRTNTALKSSPDWHFSYVYNPSLVTLVGLTSSKIAFAQAFHSRIANLESTRSFHGIGPSISWNASTPLAGNADAGQLSLDWGVNGAILFGRHRATVHHESMQYYEKSGIGIPVHRDIVGTPQPHSTARSRTVTVPNIGGFAGLSFRYIDARISLGYRADFFFGAMDGGIDARRTYDRNFSGPFAKVSIGLGG
jgi:hypothetical protein